MLKTRDAFGEQGRLRVHVRHGAPWIIRKPNNRAIRVGVIQVMQDLDLHGRVQDVITEHDVSRSTEEMSELRGATRNCHCSAVEFRN
eukprot:1987591-Heterocapsa_arctica.AAC.1